MSLKKKNEPITNVLLINSNHENNGTLYGKNTKSTSHTHRISYSDK